MKTLDQPTPRTNAEIKSEPYARFEQLFIDRSVPAQFARTLERELAAATDECLEQARLLGMSGEREADLLGKLGRLESELAAIKNGHGELGKYEQLRLKNAELHSIIDRASAQFFHQGTDGEIATNMIVILREAK